MEVEFSTDYVSIFEKMDSIDPIQYGKTRNFLDGRVTYLSPYISRGVISTKEVLEHLLAKGTKISEMEALVKELCWRDYFQRVGQTKDLTKEIKQVQQNAIHFEIPKAIVEASTGITAIDNAISTLYKTGHMHNHCRMYTASVVCNISKSHWFSPSNWMYYHLLDGDWASNACSWQWVAAANSNKRYYANQENMNRFTHTNQQKTFLDKTYEELAEMEVPSQLSSTVKMEFKTNLPASKLLNIDNQMPTFIYNYYNLDPKWHLSERGNRILLLDPAFFKQFPISEKCLNFALALSKNIPNIQVHTGSFESLTSEFGLTDTYYKEHPLNTGYSGTEEARDWICEETKGYYPSFFAYWKQVEKKLSVRYPNFRS
jgi:deoxyribodipyrimidine photo-lyase